MKAHVRNALLGAGAVVAAMTVGHVPAFAQNEIVIGLSFGRTGLYSTINKTTEVAVDIATEEINAAGGINGKKVRIVKFDTAGDPKQAVVAVRKFARDDKALAVIGPFPRARPASRSPPASARKSSRSPTRLPRPAWPTSFPMRSA